MSYTQLRHLRDYLTVIHDHFKGLYNPGSGEPFAMEIEFKITSEDVLAIKQARPWVFGETPLTTTTTTTTTTNNHHDHDHDYDNYDGRRRRWRVWACAGGPQIQRWLPHDAGCCGERAGWGWRRGAGVGCASR